MNWTIEIILGLVNKLFISVGFFSYTGNAHFFSSPGVDWKDLALFAQRFCLTDISEDTERIKS